MSEREKAGIVVQFDGVTKTFNAGTPRAYTAIRDVTFAVPDTTIQCSAR